MKTLTKHRKLVLENLKARYDHPTAKMVFDSLQDHADKISFATVYNSLEYLVEQGLVRKLDIESGSCRYDAMLEHHSHFICKSCEKIIDLPSVDIKNCVHNVEGFTFTKDDVSVTIRGICADCQTK